VCALVVLPPILVWADDDRRGWVSRSLIRRRIARFEPYETATEIHARQDGAVPLFVAGPSVGNGSVGNGLVSDGVWVKGFGADSPLAARPGSEDKGASTH
jgi:hypothetical protein